MGLARVMPVCSQDAGYTDMLDSSGRDGDWTAGYRLPDQCPSVGLAGAHALAGRLAMGAQLMLVGGAVTRRRVASPSHSGTDLPSLAQRRVSLTKWPLCLAIHASAPLQWGRLGSSTLGALPGRPVSVSGATLFASWLVLLASCCLSSARERMGE